MTKTPATDSGWNETGSPAANTPAIIGFLIAGAVILGLGFLASVWQSDEPVAAAAPPLHIVAPVHGDTVSNPVTIRFHTPADLQLRPSGWTAGDLHLHVMADDREIMPAAADISPTGTQFDWQLPPLEPGTRRLYLTWAGRDHRNLIGIADTVYLHVAP